MKKFLFLPSLLIACTGGGDGAIDAATFTDSNGGPVPDAALPAVDAAPAADAGPVVNDRFTLPYTIAAGDEFYLCKRVTVTEDLWIRAITPIDGVGTHHQVLAIDPSGQPDGIDRCGALGENWIVLFASGLGSPPLRMPDGVALKVPAGSQLVFDLHLFNASDTEIASEATIETELGAPVDAEHEAEVVLAGSVLFSIAPGNDRVVNGRCSMNGDTNFFAVFPHMHQLGKHIRVWASPGGVDQLVYDAPYLFTEQHFASFTPIPLASGDKIKVECTYDNTTGSSVSFGESSTEEMCFAISYRYPKLGNGVLGPICMDFP